jgi:LacI family transcriptional regulator, galactose operon repressor
MVTMREVAEAAGVSTATVSRVISGARAVTPEAERAVTRAVGRLGYRPHYVARALRKRTTNTIGMVVPRIANPFFPQLVQAVERALQPRGCELLLCDSQDDPVVEARRIAALLEGRVDALVLIPCHSGASRPALKQASARIPVVQLDRAVTRSGTDLVSVDNRAGIRAVVEHLRGLGKDRLAFVGADPGISSAGERLKGFLESVTARGGRSVLLGDFSAEWGEQAARKTIEHRPNAVICANDLIAVGLMHGLRRMGLSIPGDMAITGFDDIDLVAELAEPALTTVRQPVDALAARVVHVLEARLRGEERPRASHKLLPELVPRESTGRIAS